jgi:hypothetical protein
MGTARRRSKVVGLYLRLDMGKGRRTTPTHAFHGRALREAAAEPPFREICDCLASRPDGYSVCGSPMSLIEQSRVSMTALMVSVLIAPKPFSPRKPMKTTA